MVYCELCPRAYHHDCYIPPLIKVPRGKWYCHLCSAKAPPPKRRGPSKKAKDKETKDKDTKDTKEQKDTKEPSKSSRANSTEKKTSDAQRDNSIVNSTSDLSASETSVHNSTVPAATTLTPQSTKSNELSQSRWASSALYKNQKKKKMLFVPPGPGRIIQCLTQLLVCLPIIYI